MVPSERLATVDAATPFDEVLRIVAASPYSRLPVYDGIPDNIIGVLHTKDVVTAFVGGSPRNDRDAAAAGRARPW